MDINVLLIVRNEEAREKYKMATQNLGVNVIAVPSFKNLEKSVLEKRYHGLLVDLQTKFRAVKEDKEFIRNIMGKFPVAHLNIIKKTQEIKVLCQSGQRSASLENFIKEECSIFSPRRFRYFPRKSIHFNLILSSDIRFTDGHYTRTATMDISRGGCFAFSAEQWVKGNDVWFIMKELQDNTPVYGQVRHHVDWGTDLQLPGIGVEYLNIKEAQLDQLRNDFKL